MQIHLFRSPNAVIVSALCFLLLSSCGGFPQTTIRAVPEGTRISRTNDSLLTNVIARALSPSGAISIAALKTDSELTRYLEEIALVRPENFSSRLQLLAFWINAHNAYVLDMLRSNGTPKSIDDISGFRSANVVIAAGERHSLSEIEDNILVKNFREPRAFFALYDGTRSGPPLYKEAYSETRVSDQLDQELRTFLADSTRNRLDEAHNTVYLSSEFQHYSDELEKASGTVLSFVRAFAPSRLGEWIDAHPLLKISYLTHDNTIFTNDIEQPREPAHERPQPKKPTRRSSGGIN